MVLRRIIAVVAGCALWMFLFFAVGIGFGLVWPAYAEAARYMMQESDLSHFTTPMLFLNWTLFVIDGLLTGLGTTLIGRERLPALIVTALLLVYGMINHYFLVWTELPRWYNLIVPFVIAVPVALGGRLIAVAPRPSAIPVTAAHR